MGAVEAAAEAVAGTWVVAVAAEASAGAEEEDVAVVVEAAAEEAGGVPSARRGVLPSFRETRPPLTRRLAKKRGYTVEMLCLRLGVTIACGACMDKIVGVDALSIIKTNCHLNQ